MTSQRRPQGTTYSPNVYISPRRTTPAAATSPPPLIFRTRPNHSQANPPQSNTAGVINANPQLLAVYVERDRFADIQNVLRACGLPPLLVCEDVLNESTSSRVSSHGDSSRVSSHRDTGLDGRSPQYSEYLELTESFSALSTSADTVPVTPFAARTGPVLGPGSSALVSAENKAKKYYVIIVGKCAGVYWNEWDNVLPLVSNVSGARYKGFATFEAAKEYYLGAKRLGKVRIVRNPGDDQVFGPEDQAIQ